jgi:hypothetical protein
MRALPLIALMALGALAGCVSDGPDPVQGTAVDHSSAGAGVPHVDAAALVADLQAFADAMPVRSANGPDHEAARVWLMQEFASFGLETYRHDFDTGNLAGQADILGIHWGERRDEWIVVGGHYDIVPCARSPRQPAMPDPIPPVVPPGTVPREAVCTPVDPAQSQGIYDDGSGTMMTVHLAEAFAHVNTTYTLVFVAFDGEELGLEGSRNFTEMFPTGQTPYGDIRVHAMLDLDMFGLNCPGVDAPIYFDSNSPTLDDRVRELVAGLGFPCEVKYQGISLGRSDYDNFFTLEVPTGFFISSFEEYQAPADAPASGQLPVSPLNAYPFWHQFDTWDTMVLMAGSEADVVSGFQAAIDLAAGVLWSMDDPDIVYEAKDLE